MGINLGAGGLKARQQLSEPGNRPWQVYYKTLRKKNESAENSLPQLAASQL
jgi:hypothetical protein